MAVVTPSCAESYALISELHLSILYGNHVVVVSFLPPAGHLCIILNSALAILSLSGCNSGDQHHRPGTLVRLLFQDYSL